MASALNASEPDVKVTSQASAVALLDIVFFRTESVVQDVVLTRSRTAFAVNVDDLTASR